MEILAIVDKILGLRPVYWAASVCAIGLLVAFLFTKARVGVLTLERDAALGREAQLHSAVQMQNQAVLQANEQAKFRAIKLKEAEDKAKLISIERDKWKKEALNKPLTGTCEQMVDQLMESLE